MIITIDGPSGTGKSTLAKHLAERLGFTFFDTGAMYRALSWKLLQNNIDPSEEDAVTAFLPSFSYHIQTCSQNKTKKYFAGEDEVTHVIREPHISSIASQIATYPNVRQALVKIQRAFSVGQNAVFEGRDMGTVVFPDAELKIFLTASLQVRSWRRYNELLNKFPDLAHTLEQEQIFKELQDRDAQDANRSISPLKPAEDAVIIDTSHASIEQIVEQIIALTEKKKRYSRMKWPYWVIYSMAKLFFKLFFRLRILGIEHFRPGPGILAANHTSNFDPPVLSVSCPEEVHFLAKASLFKIPLLGSLIRILNSHPVSSQGLDPKTFKQLFSLLHEQKKVIVFPEGQRSKTGTLQPFERGIGFIALKSGTPIFPCYIQGTFDAWPRGKKCPKLFGKITCVFGTPIDPTHFTGIDKKETEQNISQATAHALHQLKKWLDEGAQGTPP